MPGHSPGADGALSTAVARTRRIAATLAEWLPGGLAAALRPARRVAFWAAVAIPFLLVAMLIRGLGTSADTLAFVSLLAVELLALVVGHPHRRD